MRFNTLSKQLAWAVTLTLFVSIAASGCKRQQSDDDDQQRTIVEEMIPQLVADEDETPALPELTAERPDALMRYLPVGAGGLVLVDFDAVRDAWAQMMAPTGAQSGEMLARLGRLLDEYGESSDIVRYTGRALQLSRVNELALAFYPEDDSVILITNAVAVENVPEDGAAPVPTAPQRETMIARRGDYAFIGTGAAFEGAINPELDDVFEPQSVWAAGWEALDERAMFTALGTELDQLPARLHEQVPFVQAMEATRLGISLNPNGEAVLVTDKEAESAFRQLLGVAYAASLTRLDNVVEEVPDALAGWTNYINLLTRTSWSRLRVEADDETLTARLIEGQCGRSLRNFIVGGAIVSAITRARQCADESCPHFDAAPFTNIDVPTAEDCGPLEGPPPRLPREYARIGADVSSVAMLLLADYGALFRAILPTGFQTLPFAMDHEELREALIGEGEEFSSFIDPQGRGVAYFEAPLNGTGREIYARFPEALRPVLPPSFQQAVRETGDGQLTLSTPSIDNRLADEARVGWTPLLEALPEDTILSLTLSRPMVIAFLGELEATEGPWVRLLRATDSITLSINTDLELHIRFAVDGNAAEIADDATADLRSLIAQALDEQAGQITPLVPLTLQQRIIEVLSRQLQLRALDARTVRADFGVFGRSASMLLFGGVIYAVVIPQRIYAEGGEIEGPLVATPTLQRIMPSDDDGTDPDADEGDEEPGETE